MRVNKKNDANDNDSRMKNIQRNESLDKYRSLPQRVLTLVLPCNGLLRLFLFHYCKLVFFCFINIQKTFWIHCSTVYP
jgi:hypothetical protein